MSIWHGRHYFLPRDELEDELLALCLRLRRLRPPTELAVTGVGGSAEERSVDGPAPRRCYLALRDCADLDFPRLLEAEERSKTLIATLGEVASLLRRFAQSEQSERGRHFSN